MKTLTYEHMFAIVIQTSESNYVNISIGCSIIMDKKVGLSLQRKRLDKIKRNPKNVSFQDLRSLLLGLGFKERNSGSSHYTYSRDDIAEIITVPYKRPFVSEYYVKTVLEMIDDLLDD